MDVQVHVEARGQFRVPLRTSYTLLFETTLSCIWNLPGRFADQAQPGTGEPRGYKCLGFP